MDKNRRQRKRRGGQNHYDNQIIEADLEGKASFEKEQGLAVQVGRMVDELIQGKS